MSDKAVEKGNVDSLANMLSSHLEKKIKDRFSKVLALKKEAEKSVDAGREYVKAYVIYTHYIEGIHNAIMSMNEHHSEGKEEQAGKHQH